MPFHKHRAPQQPYQYYQAQMIMNYTKAITYYEAKEKQFKLKMQQIVNKANPGSEEENAKLFEEYYEEAFNKVLPTTGNKTIYNQLFDIQNIENVEDRVEYVTSRYNGNVKDEQYSLGLKLLLDEWAKKTNGEYTPPFFKYISIFRLGDKIEQEIIPEVIKIIDDMSENNVNTLVSHMIPTGQASANSYITSGSKFIRADWIFADDKSKWNKDGAIYDNLELELSQDLDLSSVKNIVQEEVLRKYLEDNAVFGFSVKAWTKKSLHRGTSKRFAASSVMRKSLSEKFQDMQIDKGNSNSHRHHWEPDYAMMYTMWYLSKYLINIISPVQVGFMLPDGVYYFSDFLQENRFYMRLSASDVVPWNRHSKASNLIKRADKSSVDASMAHVINENASIKVAALKEKTKYSEILPEVYEDDIWIRNYYTSKQESKDNIDAILSGKIGRSITTSRTNLQDKTILSPIKVTLKSLKKS